MVFRILLKTSPVVSRSSFATISSVICSYAGSVLIAKCPASSHKAGLNAPETLAPEKSLCTNILDYFELSYTNVKDIGQKNYNSILFNNQRLGNISLLCYARCIVSEILLFVIIYICYYVNLIIDYR